MDVPLKRLWSLLLRFFFNIQEDHHEAGQKLRRYSDGYVRRRRDFCAWGAGRCAMRAQVCVVCGYIYSFHQSAQRYDGCDNLILGTALEQSDVSASLWYLAIEKHGCVIKIFL